MKHKSPFIARLSLFIKNCVVIRKKTALVAFVRDTLAFIAGGRECAVCGASCTAVQLCPQCRQRMENDVSSSLPSALPTRLRCSVCGKILVSEKNICMRCREYDTRVLRSTALVLPIFPYRLWMRNLLVLWKDEGERALSPFFAQQMVKAIRSLGHTVIVPVPPRYGKIRKKGWDQIADLCKYVNQYCMQPSGIETPPQFKVLNLLYRTNNIEQKSLSAVARLAMIDSGTYCMKKGKALMRALRLTDGIMPERVCLVDDVLTTGATVESCAAALRGAGVKEVDAVTLFVAD